MSIEDDLPAWDYDTPAEKRDWLRKRFEFEWSMLKADKAYLLDKPDWWLGYDALEHMAKLLQMGEAQKEMQQLLADFLTTHVIAGSDEKTALAILGLPKASGRTSKKLESTGAAAIYQLYIEAGETEDAALQAAWEHYYPEENRAEATKTHAGEDNNAYKQRLEKTIKPMLHKAGVRSPGLPGRPPKTPKKV